MTDHLQQIRDRLKGISSGPWHAEYVDGTVPVTGSVLIAMAGKARHIRSRRERTAMRKLTAIVGKG